ncbi:MAG: hypothetical protein L0Y72_24390 [Gemmataceae bacterium]|nr:hypothetical protein [Gemmataceae bacterium]MCI0742185.1 hypothetical protein [Gemmataceae bacterium]
MNKKKNTLKDSTLRRKKKAAAGGAPASAVQMANPGAGYAGASVQLQNGAVQWKPWLDAYRELRALHFRTREGFAAAAKLLWSGELADLPYDLVGNHTILVPAEAVPYFRGLDPTETEVLQPRDMPPTELAELRKEMGPF